MAWAAGHLSWPGLMRLAPWPSADSERPTDIFSLQPLHSQTERQEPASPHGRCPVRTSGHPCIFLPVLTRSGLSLPLSVLSESGSSQIRVSVTGLRMKIQLKISRTDQGTSLADSHFSQQIRINAAIGREAVFHPPPPDRGSRHRTIKPISRNPDPGLDLPDNVWT